MPVAAGRGTSQGLERLEEGHRVEVDGYEGVFGLVDPVGGPSER